MKYTVKGYHSFRDAKEGKNPAYVTVMNKDQVKSSIGYELKYIEFENNTYFRFLGKVITIETIEEKPVRYNISDFTKEHQVLLDVWEIMGEDFICEN